MSLFNCKVCVEKDLRIADLKSEINRLMRLTFDDRNSITTYEADAVLSGNQHIIEMEREQTDEELFSSEVERDRVLSGTYDVPAED